MITDFYFHFSFFFSVSLPCPFSSLFVSFLTSQLMSVGGGDAIRDGRYETKRPSICGKYCTALLTAHFVLIFPNRDFQRLPIRQPFGSPEVTTICFLCDYIQICWYIFRFLLNCFFNFIDFFSVIWRGRNRPVTLFMRYIIR